MAEEDEEEEVEKEEVGGGEKEACRRSGEVWNMRKMGQRKMR